ncbi:hypothetical protein Pcinc_019578 [Petrolisthes cinctipes]|uniref:Uncharacterized protein n=1 Tax=Petrolisthes cinctipes TaxID=88211 RepID=A0AAE1KKZ9_PETCI|nr:hypothetical protein Pcinc_019578 [Petrolisthes cinctipes]
MASHGRGPRAPDPATVTRHHLSPSRSRLPRPRVRTPAHLVVCLDQYGTTACPPHLSGLGYTPISPGPCLASLPLVPILTHQVSTSLSLYSALPGHTLSQWHHTLPHHTTVNFIFAT